MPPWYEPLRLITLCRPGSPLRQWYALTIFNAVSLASDPPLTGNTLESVPGAISASFSASLTVGGTAVPWGK